MTLADLYERIHNRSGLLARRRRDDHFLATTPHDEPTLAIYAGQGAVEIARRALRIESRATITLVTGQAGYVVGTSVDAPQLAVLGTVQLRHEDGARIRALAESEDAGDPACFGFFADTLYLYPKPSSDRAGESLHLYYYANSLIAEDDSAWDSEEAPAGDVVALLPPEFERPLEDYVLGSFYLDIGEHDLAHPMIARFEQSLHNHKGKPRNPRTSKLTWRGI